MVLVALMAEKAEVKYDPAYIMPSQIANHISALGYSATQLEGEVDGQAVIEVWVCPTKALHRYIRLGIFGGGSTYCIFS